MLRLSVYLSLLLLPCISFAQLSQDRPFAIALIGGFGAQSETISLKAMPDGTPIDFTRYFVKAVRINPRLRLSQNYMLGVDVGICYDYGIGYTVRRSNQSGFSIGVDAGTEIFTTWHSILNLHRQIVTYKRLSAIGYVGAGAQIYPYDNYRHTEQLEQFNPNNPNKYYYLPSGYHNGPIPVFNTGLELHYKHRERGSFFMQQSFRYSTRAFVTDYVRIETPSSTQVLKTTFTGTHFMLSFGYAYAF